LQKKESPYRRVRALLVEMAWCWLRYQPDSALTQWFNQRTQGTGPNRRARRIAIVAVARRLAIALWRYLRDGIIPAGAQLKSKPPLQPSQPGPGKSVGRVMGGA
jgi:transposase